MTVPLLGGVLPQLLPLVVPDSQLIISALAGFAVIIILITWLKMNPFLALTIGALGVGVAGGLEPTHAVESFAKGFGATMGSVGVLIGLGAMFGKLLADSGGADGIVDTLVDRSSPRMLPWTMALVGAVIGLPMFFEIGLVLLMPVIILVARRSGLPLMKIAIPTLAGLSAMHGLVPPHPGPLVAISTLNANLGLTLAFGVIVAIPTVIVAGPLFSGLAAKWAPVPVPNLFVTREDQGEDPNAGPRPSFAAALFSLLAQVAAASSLLGAGAGWQAGCWSMRVIERWAARGVRRLPPIVWSGLRRSDEQIARTVSGRVVDGIDTMAADQ